jgi:hypothetical protein
MSERRAGETFAADRAQWLCYIVRADGVACSEYVGPANAESTQNTIDYTITCAHRKRSGVFTTHCDDYVVAGTRYCGKHQHAPKYYVD